MEDKKQIESFLLAFAISSIVYCTLFAFILGIERRDYEKRIDKLSKELTLITKQNETDSSRIFN